MDEFNKIVGASLSVILEEVWLVELAIGVLRNFAILLRRFRSRGVLRLWITTV